MKRTAALRVRAAARQSSHFRYRLLPRTLLFPSHTVGRALCGAVLSLVLSIAAPLVASEAYQGSAQDAKAFADEILVQEVAVLVDFSDHPFSRNRTGVETEDLAVLEDGDTRDVTRIERIALSPVPGGTTVFDSVEACPWTFVIYIDEVLADPATIREGALAVGQRSGALVEMGCVDVVVADPIPRLAVSASRSAEYVAKTLVDLAEKARVERDRRPTTSSPSSAERGTTAVAVQWDRLVSFVADRRTDGARALLLISDGFALSTTDIEILSGRQRQGSGPDAERTSADVVADAAQALASYGWVTIAVPRVARRSAPEVPDRFDTLREEAEGRVFPGDRRAVINFFGTTRASRPGGGLDDRLYEAYVLPTLAPLRALAEATSGDVVWSDEQLDGALRRLRERRLVWFQTSEPHDGRVRRLQVLQSESLAYLPAPWWKRSSTPDLVAESRLRRFFSDEFPLALLDVEAEVHSTESLDPAVGSQSELRIDVAPVDFGNRASTGHIRISIGLGGPAGVRSFQHRIDYEAPALGGRWSYRLPLEIPGNVTRIVAGVEDLSLEEWGATVIDLVKGR